MGDGQRICATQDAVIECLSKCEGLAALQAALGSIGTALAGLPTRLADARRDAVDRCVHATLEAFEALETPLARCEVLPSFVQAWRQLVPEVSASQKAALEDVVTSTLCRGMAEAGNLDTIQRALKTAQGLTLGPDRIALSQSNLQSLVDSAVECALNVPSGSDGNVNALLSLCNALGTSRLPFDAEAHLRLRALMQRPAYGLNACVRALKKVLATLTPAPLPQSVLPRRQALTRDLRDWVHHAPAALPPLAPYQLPPLVRALDALCAALRMELDIELESPNVENDAALAARLAANPDDADWKD